MVLTETLSESPLPPPSRATVSPRRPAPRPAGRRPVVRRTRRERRRVRKIPLSCSRDSAGVQAPGPPAITRMHIDRANWRSYNGALPRPARYPIPPARPSRPASRALRFRQLFSFGAAVIDPLRLVDVILTWYSVAPFVEIRVPALPLRRLCRWARFDTESCQRLCRRSGQVVPPGPQQGFQRRVAPWQPNSRHVTLPGTPLPLRPKRPILARCSLPMTRLSAD